MRFASFAATFLLLPAAALDAQPPPPGPPILAPWPPARQLKVLRSPDWSDYRLYPAEARRREQEGTVVVEALVGKDGAPRECRVSRSSGHSELDLGTCALALQMRFAPPRDSEGANVEAVFRTRLVWLLERPTKLGAARLTAELTLDKGEVTGCRLSSVGAVPRVWPRLACRTLAYDAGYYLGPDRFGASRASVLLELHPAAGPPLEAATARGRLVHSRSIRFRLSRKGDPTDCVGQGPKGFGSSRIYADPACGLFLIQSWIKPGKPPAGTNVALFEMKVLLDGE